MKVTTRGSAVANGWFPERRIGSRLFSLIACTLVGTLILLVTSAFRITLRSFVSLTLRNTDILRVRGVFFGDQHAFGISLVPRFGFLVTISGIPLSLSFLSILLLSFRFEAFQDDIHSFFVLLLVRIGTTLGRLNGGMLAAQNLILEILDVLQDLSGYGKIPRRFGILSYLPWLGFRLFAIFLLDLHLILNTGVVTC